MNFKKLLTFIVICFVTRTSYAAPLWHSIVLDDYSTGLANFTMTDVESTALSSNAAGALGAGSSITNRRDMALFKSPDLQDGRVTAQLQISGGSLTYTDDPNSNSGSNPTSSDRGFVVQNDYGLAMSSADPLTGLDTGSPTSTIGWGYSRFVIDLGAVGANFDITFTLVGDTSSDYATATKSVTSADSNGDVIFDRTDFYGDLNGSFTNLLNDWTYWPTSVTSFGITASTVTDGGSIVFNEAYATIPEPSSALAMFGLFGGAGFLSIRRKRAARSGS